MSKNKNETPEKPKERKKPERNPRYELARLQIAKESIEKRIAAQNLLHEKKIAGMLDELRTTENQSDELDLQIEARKQAELSI